MKPSYTTALIVGAVTGLVLALALMLFVGATGGVPSMGAIVEGDQVVPVFAPPASAMWLTVLVAGAIGGLVASIATKAVSRVIDPDSESASLGVIAPLGLVIAPVIAMAVFPLGIVTLGDIADGRASIGVVRMVLLSGLVGLVAGGIIVWLSYILARPPVTAEDDSLHAETVDRSA